MKLSNLRVLWQYAGELSPQTGSEFNVGTSAMLYGRANGYFVVGGGTNFPDKNPAEGGTKKIYSDLYVFSQNSGKITEVSHTNLSHETTGGASITTDYGIFYVGGTTNEGPTNKILLITVDDNGNASETEVAELPFTFTDGFAVVRNNVLYFGAGKINGTATNKVYSLNPKSHEVTELASIPDNLGRTQPVTQILGDYIYVFSGGDKVAYTDGYRYSIANNK